MARVKRGVTKHQRHHRVLVLTKGHRGVRHRLYKRAKESLIKAMAYRAYKPPCSPLNDKPDPTFVVGHSNCLLVADCRP